MKCESCSNCPTVEITTASMGKITVHTCPNYTGEPQQAEKEGHRFALPEYYDHEAMKVNAQTTDCRLRIEKLAAALPDPVAGGPRRPTAA